MKKKMTVTEFMKGESLTFGRFLLTFMLFPRGWHFGISFNNYNKEFGLDAYAFNINLGAGAIVLGIKKGKT